MDYPNDKSGYKPSYNSLPRPTSLQAAPAKCTSTDGLMQSVLDGTWGILKGSWGVLAWMLGGLSKSANDAGLRCLV